MNNQIAATLAALPRAGNVYIRGISGFFVKGRGPGGTAGIVNEGEIVEVPRPEAFDIIAAGRGAPATSDEVKAGPMADFTPKDADGNVIPPDTRTRAQRHAAEVLRHRQAQSQNPGRPRAA